MWDKCSDSFERSIRCVCWLTNLIKVMVHQYDFLSVNQLSSNKRAVRKIANLFMAHIVNDSYCWTAALFSSWSYHL